MAQRHALNGIETVSRLFNNELLNANAKLASVSVKSRASSFCAPSLTSDGSDIAMDVDLVYNPLLVAGSKTHVKSGIYVEIEVRGVPLAVAQSLVESLHARQHVTLYSLLPDENKVT
jgi:hypothetical protein